MSLGKHLAATLVLLVALGFAGCSSGSSSSAVNTVQSAVQDLAQDPEGLVTVITLATDAGIAGATAANFSASGGQVATDVQVAGAVATVTWNARVTPSHTVSLGGLAGVSSAAHAVTTSDGSAPTFTVSSATMNPGLGADEILLQFAGPHVVAASAEDVAHWTLRAGGYTMDLGGSTLSFDSGAQTLHLQLGTLANVWASFTLSAAGVQSVADVAVDGSNVAGSGSGDAAAPTLVSAEQDMAADAAGRVIDFVFSEPMSPLMFTTPGRFEGASPDLSISVQALTDSSARVTFNNPIVPGLDTVFLNGLADAHGNAFPDTLQAITQPSPLSNALSQPAQAVTVPNGGNDYISFVTDVAFDPDSAENWSNWTLHVAGNPIDLSTQSFAYDLATRTTTITLDFNLQNGQTFTIFAGSVVDVDGVHSSLGDFQTVGGDATAPSVTGIVQNRSVDDSGATVDVTFDEDVDQAAAENVAAWSSVHGQNVQSATLQPSPTVVRLVFDAPLVPTLDTVVCSSISDLAGNATGFSQAVTASTDTTAPSVSSAGASALAGAGNDTLVVTFDDQMIASEVEDGARWTVESPVGTPLDLVPSSIVYTAATHRATLTLEAADANLVNGNDFSVAFANVHDIGHNALPAAPTTGQVSSETDCPTLESAYVESSVADELVLTFSEPCARLDDLYDAGTNPAGTRYVLRDSLGALRGNATAASVQDGGLGVRLSFGVAIGAGDTLDVLGVTDLAGNPLYPRLAVALQVEDTTAPALLAAVATTQSGEANDTLVLTFDRPMSAWGIRDPGHYSLSLAGAGAVGLARAQIAFDGNATVTLTLAGNGTSNLDTSDLFTVAATGLWSAQGVLVAGSSAIGPQALAGDLSAPGVGATSVRLDPATADSLLIEFDEALDPAAAATLAHYDLNGGNLAIAASLVGPRVVRATFAVTPLAGDSLAVSGTDLAHNASGVLTRAVQSADSAGPLVSGVSGYAQSGYGGDTLSISFSEPVKTSSAFSPLNYVVTSNGAPISLAGATATYVSATNTVVFRLARGQELDSAASVHVAISGVQDVAGNAMPATVSTTGAVGGDATPPAIASSFVDWAVDPSGATLEVGFSEDVTPAGAGSLSNWGTSGTATVVAVQRLNDDHYRVTLSAPLGASELLTVANLADPAGNAVGGALSSDPLE